MNEKTNSNLDLSAAYEKSMHEYTRRFRRKALFGFSVLIVSAFIGGLIASFVLPLIGT